MGTSRKGTKSKASKNDPKYTDRKQLFVDAYCGPAGQNAAKAGEMTGYAPGSINKLMSDPWVLKAIEEGRLAKREEFAVEVQLLVRYFYGAMVLDPLQYARFMLGGKITYAELEKIPPEVRQYMLISKVKKNTRDYEDGTSSEEIEMEFKWVDKLKCAENLAKYVGMFADDASKKSKLEADKLQPETVRKLLDEGRTRINVLNVDAMKQQLLLKGATNGNQGTG